MKLDAGADEGLTTSTVLSRCASGNLGENQHVVSFDFSFLIVWLRKIRSFIRY